MRISWRYPLLLTVVVLGSLMARQATAASLFIANNSFEDAPLAAAGGQTTSTTTNANPVNAVINGWTWSVSSGASAGIINSSDAMFANTSLTGQNLPGTADGEQFAYIGQAGASGTYAIEQVLTSNLASNNSYTLSVAVGNRSDMLMGRFFIYLFAGSTQLTVSPTYGSENTSGIYAGSPFAGNNIGNGEFKDYSVTISAATIASTFSANIGQALKIRLERNSGAQANMAIFDNVRLNTTPVPEPSALLLATFGGVTAAAWRVRSMRRKVS